jgi:pilus assembly protein TadC
VIALGAALAGVAVSAGLLALRPASRLARRLDLLAPSSKRTARWRGDPTRQLRHAGVTIGSGRFLALRVAAALCVALAAALASLVVPVGPALVALAGYAGFVAPALVVDRRAAARRSAAEREVTVLVERLEALVAAGRPPETALALLMRRPTGAHLLDTTLRSAADAYSLGAPLFRTLAEHAREEGLVSCAAVADDLERARDLGSGSLAVIRERRASLRAAERSSSLEAAAQVEGQLMLILVLCYLPALLALVVIPLFIGLLEGLFA